MRKLSDAADRLLGQPMFKVLAQVQGLERHGKKIIHFEIGDQNFSTPNSVIEAAKKSLDAGNTHYVDSYGIPEFRKEISIFTKKHYDFEPNLPQILICTANAAIDFLIRTVANPGDEIMCPDPGFPTYNAVINYAGMKKVGIPLKEENFFRIDPEDIKSRLTDKTKLIIINSPNNPTGSILSKDLIEEIHSIAVKRDIYLLSDEVYSLMLYDGKHYTPGIYDKCKERVLIINSFSKNYSMAGWRVGYVIGPEDVICKMGLMLQTIVSCLPPFIQQAAIEALRIEPRLIEERVEELKKRRDILVDGLNSLPGISCPKPEGAFYVFANISKIGLSSERFAKLILDKADVSLLPGNFFGDYGEGYVRLSYGSVSIADIELSIYRIRKALNAC